MLTVPSVVMLASSGLLAGFLTGLVSLGGAFIVVPVLFALLVSAGASTQSAFTSAVATSIAFVLVSSTSATRTYARKGMINYRLMVIVSAGALLGVLVGIRLVTTVDDAVVRQAFGVFIWILGCYLLLARHYKWGAAFNGMTPEYTALNQSGLFAIGAGVGVLVAAFGIGGGGIIAPAIALLTRSDMKCAIATGVAATVVIALLGVAGYTYTGLDVGSRVEPSLGWIYLPALLLLIPTAMLAAPLGAKLAMRLPSTVLAGILGISMFLVGAKLIFF